MPHSFRSEVLAMQGVEEETVKQGWAGDFTIWNRKWGTVR